MADLAERLGSVGLKLHPDKTNIVYCQDAKRRGKAEHTSFDAGDEGAKGRQIREWHLTRWSGSDMSSVAEEINPQVRGRINYYGAFYRSELYFLAQRINEHLVRWVMRKFKRLKGRPVRAWAWLNGVIRREPRLFAHWWLVS